MPKIFEDNKVEQVFDGYPQPTRDSLLALRELIFAVADETEGVGPIEETLKWGQPSYLTPKTKSGTTIRLGTDDTRDGDFAMFVHCQSNLVAEWQARYPDLVYGGSRSLHLKSSDDIPTEELKHCIALALTYHKRKKG